MNAGCIFFDLTVIWRGVVGLKVVNGVISQRKH